MKALPVILATAGALTALVVTSPARADGRDHGDWRGRPGWHDHGWHGGWRGPEHWRAYPRPYVYVAPPSVYYAPPPVYYAPPPPPPVFYGFSAW
jgi:hypothetical protein